MKIIAFTQIHNELKNNHLQNWFKSLSFCNKIYIFDNASTDGSREYYKQFNNIEVIYSDTNRFHEEILCKQELLELIHKKDPDTDWILWMDADTILDKAAETQIHKICKYGLLNNVDGFRMKHYNLWRSDNYYRIDNRFNELNDHGVLCLWRYKPDLYFAADKGLHHKQYPENISKIEYLNCGLIHRGFSKDEYIIEKYERYKSYGQSGNDLERLLDENTLSVIELNKKLIPDWFEIKDNINPQDKTPIRELHERI